MKSEVRVVTIMRGLAAFAVAWYHLTNLDFLSGSVIQRIGSFGWLGVESFFVISGFVIPYSLLAAGYDRSQFGSFLLRRVVRIDPPYLLSMVFCIVLTYLAYATPWYSGNAPNYSFGQIAAHLGYANNFFGYPQINRVYWTLGIEFQFYILIGLFLPALAKWSWWGIGLILLTGIAVNAMVVSSSLDPTQLISHWVPLFLMGIAVASLRRGLVSRNMLLGQLGAYAVAGMVVLSIPITLVGLATALLIAFLPDLSAGLLNWLGRISYSLYLVHVPIGERLMNISHRLTPHATLGFAIAMALTLLAAWGFNQLIEEPARRWAKRIGRTSEPKAVTVSA